MSSDLTTRTPLRPPLQGGAALPANVRWAPVDSLTTMNPVERVDADQGDQGFTVQALAERIQRDGFDPTQPVVVGLDGAMVVGGQHRLRAVASLGYEEIPIYEPSTPEQMMELLEGKSLADLGEV